MTPDAAPTVLAAQKCWYVSVGGSTAPSFMLVLGEKVPLDRPLKNPRHPPEFRTHRGSVELLIWCSWRLQRSAEVLASSDQDITEFLPLKGIEGSTITDVVCSPPAWDLLLRFSNGLELAVFCDHVEPGASMSQNWELRGPDGYVGVGPGAEWGEDPMEPG
jgi:hypothetical protein